MKKDMPMEMVPMSQVIAETTSSTRKKYSRCARGTRRNKKYHYCRSLMRKKCGSKSTRNRKTGKCEAKV